MMGNVTKVEVSDKGPREKGDMLPLRKTIKRRVIAGGKATSGRPMRRCAIAA